MKNIAPVARYPHSPRQRRSKDRFTWTLENGVQQARGCQGKIRFQNRRAAKTALKKLLAASEHDRRRSTLHIYACKHCGALHIGHGQPQKVALSDQEFVPETDVVDV